MGLINSLIKITKPSCKLAITSYLKTALLQIEIWVDDVPFKKYLETENPVD